MKKDIKDICGKILNANLETIPNTKEGFYNLEGLKIKFKLLN